MSTHHYQATVSWSGSTGSGYRNYDRTHTAALTPTTELALSADPAFRGDGDLPNPEQLIVAAASSCQLLSFLGAAARAGVEVVDYRDSAHGVMPEDVSPVSITEIELRPQIRVRGATVAQVGELVEEAHQRCFVANSLRSRVRVTPSIEVLT